MKTEIWSLDQTRALGPQLHRILRERIVRNDLRPGRRISETEIAAEYEISRQPVREAFIKLSEEGLIEVRPQRGTVVRKIAYASVLDARFVREAIEADIVKLLAAAADPALVSELRQQIAEQSRLAEGAPPKFIQLDELFHRTLAEAAGKATAWTFVEALKSQMDRVRFLSLSHFPAQKLVRQHAEIVDAIAIGDVAGAERAMRQHLREILDDLPKILNSNPGFFDEPGPVIPLTNAQKQEETT